MLTDTVLWRLYLNNVLNNKEMYSKVIDCFLWFLLTSTNLDKTYVPKSIKLQSEVTFAAGWASIDSGRNGSLAISLTYLSYIAGPKLIVYGTVREIAFNRSIQYMASIFLFRPHN